MLGVVTILLVGMSPFFKLVFSLLTEIISLCLMKYLDKIDKMNKQGFLYV